MCESAEMRKGVEVRLGPDDRERLEAVVASGNSPQKHVWRARIVLLSAEGVGTMAIQRRNPRPGPGDAQSETGTAKPTANNRKIEIHRSPSVRESRPSVWLVESVARLCRCWTGRRRGEGARRGASR
jgi:hypothetical protein